MMSPRVKLHCPLKAVEEIEPLIAVGADSFYAGVTMPRPDERAAADDPSGCLVSRRGHPNNNFETLEAFEEGRDLAHSTGKELFLTLNEHVYPAEVVARILDVLERLTAAPGLTGIIVANVGLAAEIHARFPALSLTASTGFALLNGNAIGVLRRLGFRRAVLPRAMRLDEIGTIIARYPDMEFEAFALNDRCPNIDGRCSFVHWEVGERQFPNECRHVRLVDDVSPTTGERQATAPSAAQFAISSIYRNDACAGCSLIALRDQGVRHFKVVGRDRPLKRKELDVSFVAQLADAMSERDWTEEEFRELSKGLRKSVYGSACSPTQCYYPESPKRFKVLAG